MYTCTCCWPSVDWMVLSFLLFCDARVCFLGDRLLSSATISHHGKVQCFKDDEDNVTGIIRTVSHQKFKPRFAMCLYR